MQWGRKVITWGLVGDFRAQWVGARNQTNLSSVSTKLNTPITTMKTTNITLVPNKTYCLQAQKSGRELNEHG